MASAELQQLVRERVGSSGARLVSSQARETAPEEGHQRASVDVRMRGDINSLRRVLFALASSRPMIFVDELVVTAIRSDAANGMTLEPIMPSAMMPGAMVPGAGDNKKQLLDIRIKASAYMKNRRVGS